MSKGNQSFQQIVPNESPEGSPQQVIKQTPPQPQKHVNNSFKFNIRRCMFLIFVTISSAFLLSQINGKIIPKIPLPPIFQTGPSAELFVYCPYSYATHTIQSLQNSNEGLRRRLQQNSYKVKLENNLDNSSAYDWNNTYVVEMRSRVDKSDSSNVQLVYCGLVTKYYTKCDDHVYFVCSSPGPMFDLKVNQQTDIIWVNSLDPSIYPNDGCIKDAENKHCVLMGKNPSEATKTYLDPTNHPSNSTYNVRITPKTWPTSTHVHGAQVRPTFDGNPLSWIDNSGNRGVGAFSLNDTCYYNAFDEVDKNKNNYLPPNLIVRNIQTNEFAHAKINRYPNIQNPGNLWYHDHAMRLTLYNVKYGLSGNYILRDDKVQSQIGVDRSNQKLIIMTTSGWRTSAALSFTKNIVYRFRFLNNNFDEHNIYNVTFKPGKCADITLKPIPFTIIGADSSLFNEGIYNQNYFIIAQAQRIELLIVFGDGVNEYSICTQDFESPVYQLMNNVQRLFPLNIQGNKPITTTTSLTASKNTRTQISSVTLSVPYISFKDKDSKVRVKRMRPLMILKTIEPLTINGRENFHMGKSQNPQIGSYQDWYIINAVGVPHPIHIHLINFQVVKVLTLRKIGICSLYELDFVAEALVKGNLTKNYSNIFTDPSNLAVINYKTLCLRLVEIKNIKNFSRLVEQVNVENVKDQNNVSGIDVEKKLTAFDRNLFKKTGIRIPKSQLFKYVTNQVNEIKPYYQRWKDTALAQIDKVIVLRIRWAKSAYQDDNTNNDPYFHVPVDQLREYPGYVYHCHILGHEDNEMMRPIMLELPDNPQIDTTTPCNQGPDFSWATKVKCINEVQCKDSK